MEEIGYLMVQIFLLLLMAEVLGLIMKKINMPEMVGYILAGIIFVNLSVFVPGFGDTIDFNIEELESESENFLNVMGQIGLVFLMFGIGLKTNLSDLIGIGRTAITVALMSIVLPFFGGFVVYLLFENDINIAIMVGTALFASSTTITVNMLNHLGISDTKQGKLIIGISIIVDIICLVILAVNTTIVNPNHGRSILINVLIIVAFIALIFLFIGGTKYRKSKYDGPMGRFNIEIEDIRKSLFVIAIVTCFGFTAFSYLVGLSGIVGAFLAGMYFAEFESSSHIREKFDTLTRFLLPFFFIYVGLRLHFDVMGLMSLATAAVLIVIAVSTKYAGGYIGCRMCGMKNEDSGFIATCIIARGDIAIIVATISHILGLFDTDLYAGVIIMAVTTQMLAPILIKKMYKSGDLSKESGCSD